MIFIGLGLKDSRVATSISLRISNVASLHDNEIKLNKINVDRRTNKIFMIFCTVHNKEDKLKLISAL